MTPPRHPLVVPEVRAEALPLAGDVTPETWEDLTAALAAEGKAVWPFTMPRPAVSDARKVTPERRNGPDTESTREST